jgi:hypothetical protein
MTKHHDKHKRDSAILEHHQAKQLPPITIPPEMACIDFVQHMETGEKWKLDITCKLLYATLCAYGKAYGWNDIYPGLDRLAYQTATNKRTVIRKLELLEQCGLITIRKQTKSFNITNRYKVTQPKYNRRKRYIDVNGVYLCGEYYDAYNY